MSGRFEDSPEYDAWVAAGARDEEYSDYYEKWHRRTQRG